VRNQLAHIKQNVIKIAFDQADMRSHRPHGTVVYALKPIWPAERSIGRYQMSPTHLNTFIDLEYGSQSSSA
jgi:hypothetical protein